MRSPVALLVAAGASAAFLASAAPAHAFEREWHLGGSIGYAPLFNPSLHGLGGGGHLARGMTDSFNLVGELDVTYHPAGKLVIPSAAVGGTFNFDVLQVVPYVGALIGVADEAVVSGCSASCNAVKLNLEVPFGADYQVSRSFSIGLAGRLQVFLANGPASVTVGPFFRAEYTWGY